MGNLQSRFEKEESVNVSSRPWKELIEELKRESVSVGNHVDSSLNLYSDVVFGDESYRTNLRFPSLEVHSTGSPGLDKLKRQAREVFRLLKALDYIKKGKNVVADKSICDKVQSARGRLLSFLVLTANTVKHLSFKDIRINKRKIEEETKEFMKNHPRPSLSNFDSACAHRDLAVLTQCHLGINAILVTLKEMLQN